MTFSDENSKRRGTRCRIVGAIWITHHKIFSIECCRRKLEDKGGPIIFGLTVCQLFHIIQTIIHHTVVFKEARNIKRINSKLLKILRKTQLKKKEST